MRATVVPTIWCMNEEPIEFKVMSRKDNVRHSITHRREVEVVMVVEVVMKDEEFMEDIEDEDKEVDEDK